MPIDYSKYPPNWKTEIRPRILARAKDRCECCGLFNGSFVHSFKEKGKTVWRYLLTPSEWYDKGCPKMVKVVLTISHLDHDETNLEVTDDRLKALCQLFHLRYDIEEKKQRKSNKQMKKNIIYNTNCLDGLKNLPDESINCCITSPPYWGLRDYGVTGQIGLEKNPEEFIYNLVEIFTEVKRVLRKDGTLWINIGDSYAGSGKGAATHPGTNENWKQSTNKGTIDKVINNFKSETIKPKDLVGIPWMLAFALRTAGWYLRQDIIWSKPNPMPESVKDRCTKSHEYIFLLSKSNKYYFDNESIKTPIKDDSIRKIIENIEKNNIDSQSLKTPKRNPRPSDNRKGNQGNGGIPMGINGSSFKNHKNFLKDDGELLHSSKANKRSVWEINTKGYNDAHFATFPEKLIVDCVKAGCPIDGIVLDPFMGSGTTGVVSRKLSRNYIGFELNADYIKIAEKRLSKELGMFQ